MSNESIKFNDGLQNLHSDKMAELKKLLPNLFDKDSNLIKAELENFATGYTADKQEPFCFSWAGKQKAKGLAFKQSETKLALKFDEKRGKNTDTTENLIIEGDNLHVLKLLVPSYKGKVKCIYIDPPYNTQNEFIYPDNYATSEIDYLLESGQLEVGQDVSGQSQKEKNTGRKHSNWLSFMYPRLVLARELLREDGVIFVSIDDNEVHHLRQIMNEVFGEEEFVAQLVYRRRKTQANLTKYIAPVHEYILVFGKSIENLKIINLPLREEYVKKMYKNPDNDPRGLWRLTPLLRPENSNNREFEMTMPNGRIIKGKWSCSQETFNEYIKQNILYVTEDGSPNKKIFLNESDGLIPNTWLEDIGTSEEGSKEIENLFGTNAIFDTPKPVSLIKHLLQISTAPNDLILDFFAGSGTTGQAVMELNQEELDKQAKDGLMADKTAEVGGRKFILVQLPEKIDEKKEAFKAGYKNISDITIERVRRAGEKYKSVDNGFKVLQVTESAINRKFMNSINATKEEIFAEIALQFGYGLNFTIQNLFDGVFKLTGNEKSAIVILGNEQLTNEMQKQTIRMSDELKECQIFAQDACLNVEIIHNLYQHFEQKRVVIL